MPVIVQIIIKQWDKGENSPDEIKIREKISLVQPLSKEDSFYIADKNGIINQKGDDRLGDRVNYSVIDNDVLEIDRFVILLDKKVLSYKEQSGSKSKILGSIDKRFIQCDYQWRYRVFEGGYYYWLYEHIIFNFVSVDSFDENVFLTLKAVELFNFDIHV